MAGRCEPPPRDVVEFYVPDIMPYEDLVRDAWPAYCCLALALGYGALRSLSDETDFWKSYVPPRDKMWKAVVKGVRGINLSDPDLAGEALRDPLKFLSVDAYRYGAASMAAEACGRSDYKFFTAAWMRAASSLDVNPRLRRELEALICQRAGEAARLIAERLGHAGEVEARLQLQCKKMRRGKR